MRPELTDSASRADWATRPERGNLTLLRMMSWVSLRLGRRAGRCLLFAVAVYFWLFAPTAHRHAGAYLSRALGRPPRAADHFRHVLAFAATIHDRVYLLNDRFDLFTISIAGEQLMLDIVARGSGAFLVGAHMGSFEVIRAIARQRPDLRIAMAAYDQNARNINATLQAINPNAKPDIIALGHIDAMLQVRERLDAGGFVGLLGDRTPGGEPTQTVRFLGDCAAFPVGPLRVAAMLRRPAVLMLGLYRGGNCYHVVFELLADFSQVERPERAAAVAAALARYAELLEKYCRSDPYNWFNFFDFWRIPAARAAPSAGES